MDEGALAVQIASSLGFKAVRADPLLGGKENHVVRVTTVSDEIVVRFAQDPQQASDPFDAEAWCLRAAARAGLHTSEYVAHGSLAGQAYLATIYVPGSPVAPEDLGGWLAIGEFISDLRRVQAHDAPEVLYSRFGRDLDAAWEQHLSYNLGELEPGDPLIALGVYPGSSRDKLRNVLESLQSRQLPQGLVHGDTAHRNLLRDGDVYTIIDWGAASTGPVTWGDLERIYRWHLQRDTESPVSSTAWEHVLDGAGLGRAEAEPIVRELATLHALDLTRWAIDRKPDRLAQIVSDSHGLLAAMDFEPEGRSS